MRDIDDFLPQVLTFVPTCPEPLALRYIREAARDLCNSVRLWREWDTISINWPDCNGVTSIPDADIVEIQAAKLEGHNLVPVTVGWLDLNRPGWDLRDETQNTTASYITQLNPNTVTVHPTQTGEMKVRLVLQPSLEAMTLPDNLLSLHRETIGFGAAGMALMHPVGDFINPQLGIAMLTQFRDKIAVAKIQFTKGQHGARLRTTGVWL